MTILKYNIIDIKKMSPEQILIILTTYEIINDLNNINLENNSIEIKRLKRLNGERVHHRMCILM